jgi:phosphate:Na+ symporter
MLFNLEQLEIGSQWLQEHPDFKKINDRKKFQAKTPEEKYEFLKLLQGELQVFYLSLRTKLAHEQNTELNQLVSSVRGAMHAAKSMKDIKPNITNLGHSSKDVKFELFLNLKEQTETLYKELSSLMAKPDHTGPEKLQNIFKELQNTYSTTLDNFYLAAKDAPLEDIDLTTVISFNRELFTSNKALIIAVKDFLLNEKEATDFNDIAVYLT